MTYFIRLSNVSVETKKAMKGCVAGWMGDMQSGALLAQWAAVVSNSCKFKVATKLVRTTTITYLWCKLCEIWKKTFWVSAKLKPYARYDICRNSWRKTTPFFLKRRSKITACFPWKSSQSWQLVQETSHTLRNSRQQMEKTTWKNNLFPDVLGVAYGVTSQTYCNSPLRVNHLYY